MDAVLRELQARLEGGVPTSGTIRVAIPAGTPAPTGAAEGPTSAAAPKLDGPPEVPLGPLKGGTTARGDRWIGKNGRARRAMLQGEGQGKMEGFKNKPCVKGGRNVPSGGGD